MCVHSCGRKTLEVVLAHCLSVGVDRMQQNEVGFDLDKLHGLKRFNFISWKKRERQLSKRGVSRVPAH
jgi:hypothetical protein